MNIEALALLINIIAFVLNLSTDVFANHPGVYHQIDKYSLLLAVGCIGYLWGLKAGTTKPSTLKGP